MNFSTVFGISPLIASIFHPFSCILVDIPRILDPPSAPHLIIIRYMIILVIITRQSCCPIVSCISSNMKSSRNRVGFPKPIIGLVWRMHS